MTANITDACPECKSTDVAEAHSGRGRGRFKRRYFCYDCGIRFNNPRQYDTFTEEFV